MTCSSISKATPTAGFESAGLEYLWGVSDAADGFRAWWAHEADAEQDAFEGCVDFFMGCAR